MTVYLLIAYDISDDKLRLKVANRLQDMGLDRVQKSVFMGMTTTALRVAFDQWWATSLQPKVAPNDSILILDLQQTQILRMQQLGNSDLDIPYLVGLRNTLFF